MTSQAASEPPRLTLRIAGLGHSLTMRENASSTVSGLQSRIQEVTGIPSCYQRLVARGLKLEDGQATLEELGLKDRTKILLLHSPEYAQEKDGYEMLVALSHEIDALEKQSQSMEHIMISEMVTRICCKLDAIDTAGSMNLRNLRKDLIRRAEELEQTQTGQDSE
jgi:BAG domain/Ubiquitin family